jgi:carotenoid 1,2-hydratase
VSFSLDISSCSRQLSLIVKREQAHLYFCSPVQRGSWREATEGVFLLSSETGEANTPSALRAPPPLDGGGKQAAPHLTTNGPRFDCAVGGDGGYVWWYVDAISDDGVHGLTMIAFIGSVFSPYYAWSNWADPFQHCAINVALYRLDGAGGRWAMTERGAKSLSRDATHFAVGPSHLRWENGVLTADINEITMPIASPLKGTIRLVPDVMTDYEVVLDTKARHHWRPLAPRARVELKFDAPNLNWSGDGYFDTNRGSEPLERAFQSWHWGRAHRGKDLMLFYDCLGRDKRQSQLALQVDPSGAVTQVPSPPTTHLPSTFWRVDRTAWGDQGQATKVIKTLEDTPFYARSALQSTLGGERVTMMHESLDLDRLKHPIVRAMLPFRMPRRA